MFDFCQIRRYEVAFHFQSHGVVCAIRKFEWCIAHNEWLTQWLMYAKPKTKPKWCFIWRVMSRTAGKP